MIHHEKEACEGFLYGHIPFQLFKATEPSQIVIRVILERHAKNEKLT